MTSYNQVILTGKVAISPRRHYRPDGSPVVQFPLELDEVKELPGQEQPQVDRRAVLNRTGSGSLIDIVAFGELAEFKFDLLQSGQHLLVVGRLNQRHWQTPEGKKRTHTEVIATDLQRVEELNQTTVCPACGRPCTGLVQGRQATGKMGSTERGERNEETC
jgi:single-strand DNA-binding protein